MLKRETIDIMVQFYDCSAESISIDIYGIATINYTIISDSSDVLLENSYAGFSGYISNINIKPIPNSMSGGANPWYITTVTLIGTSDGSDSGDSGDGGDV